MEPRHQSRQSRTDLKFINFGSGKIKPIHIVKLERLFKEAVKLISEFPEIGIDTDFPGLRIKVIKSYKLFYTEQSNTIKIIRIWDTRQNPQRLKLP